MSASDTADDEPCMIGEDSSGPPAYIAPPSYRQTPEELRFAAAQRRTADVRVVQAVSPFGVRDNDKISIPPDCKIVKQLAREAAVAGQLSRTPDGSEANFALHSAEQQAMIEQYQSAATSDAPMSTFSPAASFPSWPQSEVHKPAAIQVPQHPVPASSYSPASAQAAAERQRTHSVQQPPAQSRAPPPPPPYVSYVTDENRNYSEERLAQRAGSTASLTGGQAQDTPETRATTKIMNLLSEENKKLRNELDQYMRKAFKVQQLELSYQRIQREYEDLVRSTQKRDQLETQVRNKLEHELQRTTDSYRRLQEQFHVAQIDLQNQQMNIEEQEDVGFIRHEMTRLNLLLAQLMPQNKELMAIKERQEIELQAQNTTLEEQRNHIQILDRALKNAQTKVVRMEEEREKKHRYLIHVEQLVHELQRTNEEMNEREKNHKDDRARLEKELAQMQLQKAKDNQSLSGAMKKANSGLCRASLEPDEQIMKLKRELEEKNEELIRYKSDKLEWEKSWCENQRREELEMESQDKSRDQYISELEDQLEQMRQWKEEIHSETEKQQDLVREQKSKINNLTAKIQALEARLAERDAMINVLKKRSDSISTTDSGLPDIQALDPPTTANMTRSRLAAARIRLLQAPSPSTKRFPWRVEHSKWPGSHDSSFVFDTNGGADYSSLDRPGKHYKSSVSDDGVQHKPQSSLDACMLTGGRVGTYKKQNDNSAHRSRVLSSSQAEKKSARSHSADEHLIEVTDEQETTSKEELWHV